MILARALALAALFGAGDQYLGSFSAHPWMADVSLLSAPWLLVPFLAGWTQRDPRRAAIFGLLCTISALVGYGAMTLSPLENAHMSLATIAAFLRSEVGVFIGGTVTGPLFGWFGQQWRVDRAWRGALATAAVLCLEPLARSYAGHPIRSTTVLLVEVAVGIALVTYVAARTLLQSARGGSPCEPAKRTR